MAAYPLEAALTLRRSERMRAEGALATALRACEDAQATRQRAQEAFDAHVAATPPTDAPEQPGRASSAVELQRAASFAQRHAMTARRLRDALARAADQLVHAQAALQRALHALARAHAHEQAAERDRGRFEQAEQRAADDAEEQEHADNRAARRSDRPGEP